MYAVPPSRAFNLSNYPFPRNSIYSASTEERNLRRIQQYQTLTYVPAPVVVSPSSIPAAPTTGAPSRLLILRACTGGPCYGPPGFSIVPMTEPQRRQAR